MHSQYFTMGLTSDWSNLCLRPFGFMQDGFFATANLMTKRLSYNGSLCTVKWNGKIPQWNELALGVEWDNASRGKNDGRLDGVQYFTCRVKGAGSFVKSTRKPDKPVNFGDAVSSRYMENPEWYGTAISGHKSAEFVGADKIQKRRSNVEALETISVQHSCVSSMKISGLNFTALRRLDLSNNLLEDLSDVCNFLTHLNVESLALNGNRFAIPDSHPIESVRELELARTFLSSREISRTLKIFPRTRSLSLVDNLLEDLPVLPELEELDVSFNLLGEPFIHQSTRVLNFSHNSVHELTSPICIPDFILLDSCLPWASFEWLERCRSLRTGNPSEDRPFIIARLPRLESLNGTHISAKEREDSERYTLSAVVNKKHPPLPTVRSDELVAQYGRPPAPPEGSLRSQLLPITVDGENYRIFGHASVQRLIWLVSRRKCMSVWGLRLMSDGELLHPFTEVRMISSLNLTSLTT